MTMRIALMIESSGAGGAERMVAQLARELSTLGHSIVVYVPPPPRGEGWLEEELRGSRVEVDHFWLKRPFDPGCARELAASLRSREIEIAHGHEFSLAFYGAWAARIAGIPNVITMHGRVHYPGRIRRRVALRAAVMSSGATVSVSHALGRQLADDLWLPQGRIKFIPNGVRLLPVPRSTLREELRLSDDQRLILSVGSLYPVKGHRYLLEAVAKLSVRHPDLHVAIAGQGHLLESLREQSEALGLGPRLHLLGLRTDVANLLAACDVFALPSLSEGLPLALLEAMLAGRPIVATDVGDNRLVLGDGKAGLMVEPGDADGLAEGLNRVLTDSAGAQRMAECAARRANEEYRLERMTNRYETLYRSLLRRKTVTPQPVLASAASLA
jgi:glycosyltransferase involved in cell wall biosynthesis